MSPWVLLVIGCGGSQAGYVEAAFPDGVTQLAVTAEATQWGACPPSVTVDCRMAVLEGDPREPQLFTVRFQITEALELRPHWHPRNERVTVLEGRVGIGFGDEVDRERVRWFEAGDYYVNAAGAHHFVLTDGPVLLQITGIGPWQVRYLE